MNKPSAPPAPPKPPPPRQNGAGNLAIEHRPASSFKIAKGQQKKAIKAILFGSGGVGKSELCSLIKQVGIEPLFLDIEEGTSHLDVARVEPAPANWDELRAILHSDVPDAFGAIVIDSLTKAEEMAIAWTCANVPHEKQGKIIKGIEDYGFGKGYTHVYETFLTLLSDLDIWVRRGKHVLCTAHDCTANVPNPAGDDWSRWEPRLQSPPSGKGSIRHRVREWTDHLIYIGYDVAVIEGKGQGAGTRTLYPTELPTHMAKSRTLSESIIYNQGDAELWKQLLGVN